MRKLSDEQMALLRQTEMFQHVGGNCPATHSEYRTFEALRKRKLVRRINKSRAWERSFYELTGAGRAALAVSEREAGRG